MKIRLLSWNVHGLPWPVTQNRAARMTRIGERIVAEAPDVVALQEVWPGAIASIVSAAPGYSAVYVPTTFGAPSGGLVVLVRDGGAWMADAGSLRFRTYSTYGAWHRLWEGDGVSGKGALVLALRDAASGDRLQLVVTHLQARYAATDYADVRRSQLEELARWLEEPAARPGELDGPVLIAGDFNTPATETGLYEALAALGTDLTRETRERTGAVTNFPLHASRAWIDYVLLRPGAACLARSSLRLIENERLDYPYSDHSGLVADVELRR